MEETHKAKARFKLHILHNTKHRTVVKVKSGNKSITLPFEEVADFSVGRLDDSKNIRSHVPVETKRERK